MAKSNKVEVKLSQEDLEWIVGALRSTVKELLNEEKTGMTTDGLVGPKTLAAARGEVDLESRLVNLANRVYDNGQGDINLTDYIDELAARAGELEAEAEELRRVRGEVRQRIVAARASLDHDLWFAGVEARNVLLKELGELLGVKEAELL